MRYAIVGGPGTGKTTLANQMALSHRVEVMHTDDLIEKGGFSEQSLIAAQWLNARNPALIIEGVTVVRALRKWLAFHPEGRPVDKVIWLTVAHKPLRAGQERLKTATDAWMQEILVDLSERRVTVEVR